MHSAAHRRQHQQTMTDIILSSFISLFALFGKEEQVDEARAKDMLVSYLRHHFGIRNIDTYLDLYTDMRAAYEMTADLDTEAAVASICSTLNGNIRAIDASMLLLRLMEFGGMKDKPVHHIFRVMAQRLNIAESQLQDFTDFVNGQQTSNVRLHHPKGYEGELKTLLDPVNGLLIFTYTGQDTVLLNDVPVLPGACQIWLQSSVLKSHTGHALYYASVIKAHNRALGKVQQEEFKVNFSGRDLNFRYPGSNNGLHNFSFTLRSGELTAIMGGSGTGKTTLLSILNGNIKPQEGAITINGHDINEPETKALIGFVPQDDLLIEELTVYQNLWYTTRLCFDGLSDAEVDSRVMKMLKDLELTAAKDLKVGSPVKAVISGGQRKRLNIALELIREPAVLFLDEPTSGLSSTDTEKVISLLKEQTIKGKLIVANIHQPSSDVYKLFDRLWVLDRGGYPVFDGNPIDAITYFKQAADYADAETSACPTCGNINPEVMLNIIDEKRLNSSGELSDERKQSPEEWHQRYIAARGKMPKAERTDVPPSQQRKAGRLKQFGIFLERNVRTKITNVQYLALTLLEAPALAVVCSLLTRYAPAEGYSVMDNKNLLSYFFMAIIVATFTGMSGSAEEIIRDRALLKREKFLQLSYGSYISSKIVYLAIVSLLQTFLFIVIGNTIMGLHGLFLTWWLILFVTALLANLTGLLLSQCLSSVVAIYVSIPILLIPQILLCGLVVSFTDLTPRSTTGNVPLIGDVIPSRWAYEALAVTSFTDNPYERPLFENDKQKFQNEFYNMGYLYELQSQLETMHDEQQKGKDINPMHMDVLRKNMHLISDYLGIEPYQGDESYESLRSYMKEAERMLSEEGNKLTLKADRQVSQMVRDMGKDAFIQLKRDHQNLKLRDIVTGADQKRMVDIIDGWLVPRTGMIFLTPQNIIGRAPFYSSEKIVGPWHIKTLWFNLTMMLLMCIITAILLYADWPGRRMRKN